MILLEHPMTTRLMWVRRKGAGFMPSHRCDCQEPNKLRGHETPGHLPISLHRTRGVWTPTSPRLYTPPPTTSHQFQLLRIDDGQIDQTTLWSFISDFWSILDVFHLFFFFCLVTPRSLQDLSSPSRVESGPPQWKHWVLTSGLPGNSLHLSFIQFLCKISLVYCLWKIRVTYYYKV